MTTNYEMLWDCSSCGTTKLLGKTHRRCPNCGAPQDPTKRYFPPPGQEVEAAGHIFVGADWSCAACQTPNSKAAAFCVNCGNPRDGNTEVKGQAEQFPDGGFAARRTRGAIGTASAVPGALDAPRSRTKYLVAGAGALLLGLVLIAVFWKKTETVTVERHSWSRDVDVESYQPRSDSAWCSSMPGGAYNVSRHREQRSTRQIADGQECHNKRVDNRDGTFHNENVCQTKYRSEPVYDDKCYFTIDRWGFSRRVNNSGVGLSPPPSWPTVRLGRTGQCIGCEREGPRHEKLVVDLVSTNPKRARFSCEVDTGRWTRFQDGQSTPMQFRVVTGGAVCSSFGER